MVSVQERGGFPDAPAWQRTGHAETNGEHRNEGAFIVNS
jgi:hypothetical protein